MMIGLIQQVEAGPADASRSALADSVKHGPAWEAHLADMAARDEVLLLVLSVERAHPAAMQGVDCALLVAAIIAMRKLERLHDGVLQVCLAQHLQPSVHAAAASLVIQLHCTSPPSSFLALLKAAVHVLTSVLCCRVSATGWHSNGALCGQ